MSPASQLGGSGQGRRARTPRAARGARLAELRSSVTRPRGSTSTPASPERRLTQPMAHLTFDDRGLRYGRRRLEAILHVEGTRSAASDASHSRCGAAFAALVARRPPAAVHDDDRGVRHGRPWRPDGRRRAGGLPSTVAYTRVSAPASRPSRRWARGRSAAKIDRDVAALAAMRRSCSGGTSAAPTARDRAAPARPAISAIRTAAP